MSLKNLFRKKPKQRRRSSLEEMGSKSQLSEEELQDLHDLSERERLNIESQTIRADGAAALRRLRKRPKRKKPKSRRKSRKRNTSWPSLSGVGEEDKYYDYTLSDTRPRDNYGYLTQPPPPEPTVQMRIRDSLEEASGASKNHMGGKTRKRRRKRRRKTKRKGRRKTKKRRKRRKRKTRRKR